MSQLRSQAGQTLSSEAELEKSKKFNQVSVYEKIIKNWCSGVVRNLNLGVPKNFEKRVLEPVNFVRSYHIVTYKI